MIRHQTHYKGCRSEVLGTHDGKDNFSLMHYYFFVCVWDSLLIPEGEI